MTTPSAPRISEDELAERAKWARDELWAYLAGVVAAGLPNKAAQSILVFADAMVDAARSAPAAGLDEEVIPIRKLVVAWFHDSEEICEHDEPPASCEIMTDHLLAAFSVRVRDWKAYAADNRLSAVIAAEEVR